MEAGLRRNRDRPPDPECLPFLTSSISAPMNECVAECEKTPKAERRTEDEFEVCCKPCAKEVFHPCLDPCKTPKPDWATG